MNWGIRRARWKYRITDQFPCYLWFQRLFTEALIIIFSRDFEVIQSKHIFTSCCSLYHDLLALETLRRKRRETAVLSDTVCPWHLQILYSLITGLFKFFFKSIWWSYLDIINYRISLTWTGPGLIIFTEHVWVRLNPLISNFWSGFMILKNRDIMDNNIYEHWISLEYFGSQRVMAVEPTRSNYERDVLAEVFIFSSKYGRTCS